MTSSKTPSIAIGVAVYVVLGLVTAFIAFSGGTAGGMIGFLFGCMVMLAVPVIAVWHYTSTNALTLTPGEGAGLGALTTAVGALLGGLVSLGLQAAGVFPTNEEIMEEQRNQMISQGMSPEEVDQAMSFAAAMSGSPVVSILSSLVIGAVVGAIAGAIAAAVFKKGDAELV